MICRSTEVFMFLLHQDIRKSIKSLKKEIFQTHMTYKSPFIRSKNFSVLYLTFDQELLLSTNNLSCFLQIFDFILIYFITYFISSTILFVMSNAKLWKE